MEADGLDDLVSNPHDRVESCHGILKDHGDLISPQFPQSRLIHGHHIFSLVENLSAYNLSWRVGDQV